MSGKDYLLQIEGDYNDGDYITASNRVSKEEIETIMPVIEAIKACEAAYNWPTMYHLSETIYMTYPNVDTKLLEIFREYTPYGEAGGVHSIESIVYWPIKEKVTLL